MKALHSGRIRLRAWAAVAIALWAALASAQTPRRVRDLETRPGVTTRVLDLPVEAPKAVILLYGGGDGGLQMRENGSMLRLDDTFLVRSRHLFAANGIKPVVVDAPSDRQRPPYLDNFRHLPEWIGDVRALVKQYHQETGLPVWVSGTSASSPAMVRLASRLVDEPGFGGAVATAMCTALPGVIPSDKWDMSRVTAPFLIVQHKQDGCGYCPGGGLEDLVRRTASKEKALLWFDGGQSSGNPCYAQAYHGFNGIEPEVAKGIADWIKARR